MSFHVPKPAPTFTLALYGLFVLGLALVLGARILEAGPFMAMAGVACWIVATGVLFGHAGPHSRR